MNSFVEKLTEISSKFARNTVLKVIQGAFMMLLPIMMIGGFTALLNGIGVDAYQAFLVSTGIKGVLSVIYQWTIGMVGVYLSFLVAYQFAKTVNCAKSEIAVGLTSLVSFLIVTPIIVPETPWAPSMLPTQWLGSSGMFSAIVIAFITGLIFLFCSKYKIIIKLPEQVPPFISAQFSSLIPAVLTMVLFGALSVFFAKTSFGTLHQLVYATISSPLRAVGSNVFGGWLLMIMLYGLWFFGIHGGMTVGPVLMMLFMPLQMENLTAFQAGLALPNIYIGDALTYGTGALPMLVAALLICKSAANKSISRFSFIPALFGVDEPAYFGMPMILNPIFFVPWVIISPTVSVLGSYLLKVIGLLPFANGTAGANTANLPFFVGNLMSYGISGLIWGFVLFAIIVLAYIPFVKAYDKQQLEKEATNK